jgi:hypothetical protein
MRCDPSVESLAHSCRRYGGKPTDAASGVKYGSLMPQSVPEIVFVRAKNIAEVADDLTRELVRAQIPPHSALVDLVGFIQTEAEWIMVHLNDADTI